MSTALVVQRVDGNVAADPVLLFAGYDGMRDRIFDLLVKSRSIVDESDKLGRNVSRRRIGEGIFAVETPSMLGRDTSLVCP